MSQTVTVERCEELVRAAHAAWERDVGPKILRIKELEDKLEGETKRADTGWQLANEMKADRDAVVLRLSTYQKALEDIVRREYTGAMYVALQALRDVETRCGFEQTIAGVHGRCGLPKDHSLPHTYLVVERQNTK